MMAEKKIEQIGNIKLDLTYYSGQDLYCDGAVEDELLDIVKNHTRAEFQQIIEGRKSWPVLYHLSPLRENIVDWIPMEPDARVLEVGSGCGAITGALSRKAGEVTCVELSKKRSTINAHRNSACENVTIHVGNFADIEPGLPTDYDYICLIGVFEYGQSYMQTDKPYETFLNILMRHLGPGGRLIIAIENRYGMKYFAGCQEDHLGRYFAGIEGYDKEDGVRTFGRKGLEKIFAACRADRYSFYYPYPDYKFMTSLYSDDYLPGKGELSRNICNYDRDRMLLFDEKQAFDGAIDEELFPVFANSYVAVIGEGFDTSFVKYSNDRAAEYQISTRIGTDGTGRRCVSKHPVTEKAKDHIRSMGAACESLKQRYAGGRLEVNRCQIREEADQVRADFEYVPGIPLSELMDQCLEKDDLEGFRTLFREFVDRTGYNPDYPAADYDMVFANILVDGDKWTVIDYEWTFGKQVEVRELAFRAVHCYLLEDEKRTKLDLDWVCRELRISPEQAFAYMEQERQFQKFVTGQRRAMGEIRDLIGNQILKPVKWLENYESAGNVLRLQIYEDRGGGYSEEDSYFPEDAYRGENWIETELLVKGDVQNLRIDPAMDSCVVKVHELRWNDRDLSVGDKRLIVTNGRVAAGSVIFPNTDPNINIRVSRLPRQEQNRVRMRMEIRPLPESMARDLAASIKKLI